MIEMMPHSAADKPLDLASAGSMLNAVAFAGVEHVIEGRSDEMIAFRRSLHREPEASGRETQTTATVAAALRAAGLDPRIMRDGLGVVCDLDLGGSSGECIALRAELDAVDVPDDKRVPYASTRANLCHACGHDAHATIVLSVMQALMHERDGLRGLGLRHNVRAIFQPAEETAIGARSMIEQGATHDVAAIIAVHVEPFIETGVIGLRVGPLTSACRSFEIHVKGRSGHSARPFQALDPIPAAVSLTDLFYQLCPRSMDSRYPLALTVSSLNAGHAFNAIPDFAIIRGTLRTSRAEDLAAVESRMRNIIRGVAQATGCEISMTTPVYAPATDNDETVIGIMNLAASSLLGPGGVKWLDVPSLGAEDFAFYQELVPGAIVRLGAALPDAGDRMPLHSSLFDIDERSIAIGAKFLSRTALLAAATFDRSASSIV